MELTVAMPRILVAALLVALCACAPLPVASPSNPAVKLPRVSREDALRIAEADAVQVYSNVHDGSFLVEAKIEYGRWCVDYWLIGNARGNGPHYRIDVDTGEILDKWYEQ
jgi:hypothetical protein